MRVVEKFLDRLSVFSCFMFTVYFVLHEFNANYGLISSSLLLALLAKYLIIEVAIFFLWILIFRNYKRAILLTFITIFWYFFFGAIHDRIKANIAAGFFRSHTFLYLLIATFILAVILFIRRRQFIASCVKYLTVFSALLFLWEFGHLFVNIIMRNERKNNLVYPIPLTKSEMSINVKPDIFYIVLDSYAGFGTLSEDFGYHDPVFESFLKEKNFYVADKSISNYPLTPFSVASTLSMQYLDLSQDTLTSVSAKDMLRATIAVSYAIVPPLLAANQYKIYNYSIFDFKQFPALNKNYFGSIAKRLIDEQTIEGRFKKYLLWKFSTPATKKWRSSYIHEFINSNFNGLVTAANLSDTSARFVYCHVMLPHEPYFFKANGDLWSDSSKYDKRHPKKRFIEQTTYTNRRLIEIINVIMKNRTKPYVIILQGDHGFRDFESINERQKIFQNLSAFYFSDKDYRLLYNSISNVNTFRVIFNKYLNTRYPLLADSAVYLRDTSFNFEHAGMIR